MGGNVKDAMTEEPKVERECRHCESTFEDTVKYGPAKYCSGCKEKFDDPEYIQTSIELEVTEDAELLAHVILDSDAPDGIRVRVPGREVEGGILFARVKFESDKGQYKDVICSDEQYMYHDLKVRDTRTETLQVMEEPDNDIRGKFQKSEGNVVEGDEVSVEVEFECDELDGCSSSITTPEAVAQNI